MRKPSYDDAFIAEWNKRDLERQRFVAALLSTDPEGSPPQAKGKEEPTQNPTP